MDFSTIALFGLLLWIALSGWLLLQAGYDLKQTKDELERTREMCQRCNKRWNDAITLAEEMIRERDQLQAQLDQLRLPPTLPQEADDYHESS